MAFIQSRTLDDGTRRYDVRWVDEHNLTASGRPKDRSKSFRDKRSAERFLRELQSAQDEGRWIEPAAGKVTLADYAEQWLRSRRPTLSTRTAEVYAVALNRHILPTLGRYPINRLTPTLINGWWGDLTDPQREPPLAPATTAKAYRLLKQILSAAVAERAIGLNPCTIKGASADRSAERPTASIPQVFALADNVPDRYRALILLAGFSGLRLGELRALRRQDVDLSEGTVRVEASISELQNGTLVRKDVKTAAGRRTVTIPGAVLDDVRRHMADHVDPDPDAAVFTSPTGAPFRASNFSRHWDKARQAVGLEGLHLHDLRHTSNTLAALSGASVRELMGRMGHASQRAAVRYQHLVRTDQGIADAMSALIESTRAQDTTDG